MDELLAEPGREPLNPRRGDIVEGIVVHWTGPALIVDVGAKSEGIVHFEEMRSLTDQEREALKTGDPVHVFVTDSESEGGSLELSIDRARGEQGWHELQRRFDESDVFDARVTGSNKGGLLVNVEGVNAFVPLSQIVEITGDRDQAIAQLAEYEGRTLRFKVIEINRRRNRVILSERAAVQEWRAEQKDRLLEELQEGEIRSGRVTSIRSFGVFVDLGGADGLAHLSELSWERDVDPEAMFSIGQTIDVYITKIDKESKKIGLSVRRASPEQWDEVVAKFVVGEIVPSVVTKLVTFGAFARLEARSKVWSTSPSWPTGGLRIRARSCWRTTLFRPRSFASSATVTAWDSLCARLALTPSVWAGCSTRTAASSAYPTRSPSASVSSKRLRPSRRPSRSRRRSSLAPLRKASRKHRPSQSAPSRRCRRRWSAPASPSRTLAVTARVLPP